MERPSYDELERRVKELQRLVNIKAYPKDFQFTTKDLIYFKGYRDWSVDFFDKKIEDLTGYSQEDFLNRKIRWLDIVHQDDRDIAKNAVKVGMKSDKYYIAEYRIVATTGDIKWIKIRGFIQCDDKGNFLFVQGVLNDISSQKFTELALECKPDIFAWIADNLEDGIYIISGDYRIQFMNKALIELVGNHVGEVCYKALFQRDSPCPWTVMNAIKQNSCGIQEYRLPGRIFQVRSFGIPMPDESTAKMGLLKDLTRRRSLQKKVKEFAARYQAVANAADRANLGIFILQNHGGLEARFRYANEAFSGITGYRPEELLDKSLVDLLHPDYRQTTLERYRRGQAGEESDQVYEIKIIRKDGQALRVSYSVALSPYEGKVATVGFLRDITEKRRVEKALWRSQRLASIGRLAAEIAHEVNNPLTSAVTFSKLVRKIAEQEPFPESRLPELREYISYMDAEASRCAETAKGLLDFSRQGEIEIKENDLREILEKTLDIIRHRSELGKINIVTSHAPGLPHVICDYKRLQQAVLNIFWNAIEAMPEGGMLSVATSFDKKKGAVVIDISDTGCGISEEDQEKIFEPFFTTKAEGKGAGLGLSVAYGIIRQHKGQISIQSHPGKGTHFTIELPDSSMHLHWLRPPEHEDVQNAPNPGDSETQEK